MSGGRCDSSGSRFFALAAYVAFESVRDLATRSQPEVSAPSVAISLAALVVMPALAWAKRSTGRALESRTILADAAETAFCAWLAASALTGQLLNAVFIRWEGLEAFEADD